MPTVPALNPTVRMQALPGPRLSGTDPSAMGANLGRGLQQLGGEMAQWAAEERRKKIETDVTAAVNQLDAASANGIRLARDPKEGIKGATAKDDLQRFTEDFDKREKEYAQGLTDPEARRIYSMRAMQRRNAYAESLMNHADGVVMGYQNDQDQQTVKLADERAGLNFDNPKELATARADKEAALARLAERNGWSPERLAAERMQATSSMHMQVLRGYTQSKRVTEAADYLKALKPEEMTAADRDVAQRTIGQMNDTAKAQGIADQAHALVRSGVLQPTDVEDWLKEQAGESVAIRDGARNRFKVLEASYREAASAEVSKATDAAYRILMDNGGDITEVEQDEEIMGTLNRYDPEKIGALRSMAAKMSEPPKVQSDPLVLTSVYGTDPDELAKMGITEFYNRFGGKLSPGDYEEAVKHWGRARESRSDAAKKAEVDAVFTGARSEKQIVDDTLRAAGYDPALLDTKDVGTEQAKNSAIVAGVLDRALAGRKATLSAERKTKITTLPPDETAKVVSDTMKAIAKPGEGKGALPWNWFNDRKGSFVLPEDAQARMGTIAFGINEVPRQDRDWITDRYRRVRGREPTAQEVVDEYNRRTALPATPTK